MTTNSPWPPLPLSEWADTSDTLHLWIQVVGKVRLLLNPLVDQWWNVPLYVTSRGLSTSPIPHIKTSRQHYATSRRAFSGIALPPARFGRASRWQAATWPDPASRSSGSSVRHRSKTYGQRV
jgi:hypothetical protein